MRLFYKNKKTRVGLIVTMSLDETWPDTFVDRVKSYLPKAREALKKLDFEVFDEGEIARTAKQMASHGEELRRKNIHVLVIFQVIYHFLRVGVWLTFTLIYFNLITSLSHSVILVDSFFS